MAAAAAPSGPTRAHWISDAKTTHCAEPGCGKLFEIFWTHRHHCRRCGLVFCSAHSSHRMRLGPDARPSESGELSRVCAKCLTAADDTHTAADVTKIGKMADAASRWAQVTRLPASSLLQLHVAGHVVSRSRTAFFKAKRAQNNAHETARVEATVRAYAALSGTAAERAAAGVLDLPKGGDRALAAAAACGMPACRKPLSTRAGRHRCKICATIICSACASKKSWALPPSDASEPPPAGIEPGGGGQAGGAEAGELTGGGASGGGGGGGRTAGSPGDAPRGSGAAADGGAEDRMGAVARTCSTCTSLLERFAVARRISAMRAAAAASPLSSAYAQLWATTATLRAEAHSLEAAMLRLAAQAGGTTGLGAQRSSAPPSLAAGALPSPPPAAPISASVLHDACRSTRAVEALLPSVLALLKAFKATPLDFEAEASVKEEAVRAPAELIKLVMPRFHAHKRVLQRHAEALGMSVEQLAITAPRQLEALQGEALRRARQPVSIAQPVGEGNAIHAQSLASETGAGGPGGVSFPCGSAPTGARPAGASGFPSGVVPPSVHPLLCSDSAVSPSAEDEGPHTDTEEGHAGVPDAEGGRTAAPNTGGEHAAVPPPAPRAAADCGLGPRGLPGGARAAGGSTCGRWASVGTRTSYAASMVGAAAAYIGATAAYAVGASAPAGSSAGGGRSLAAGAPELSLQEYLVARRAFIELQRGLQLYSPQVGRLADSAKAVHASVLKLMQEELQVRATRLGLDVNAQLVELTHAITAPRSADGPFRPPGPPGATTPELAGPHSMDKGAMLSKLLGVATQALADLEDEVSLVAFRPARQALVTLKALLRDVYVAECIPY